MSIRAFIFDLDGVITDTTEYHYLSWKQLADEEGLPFSREDNEKLRGLSRRDSLIQLLKGKTVDEATMQAWMERKNAYYQTYLNRITSSDRLPGVTRFIEEAQTLGIRIGIGSASRNAREVLMRLDLFHTFDVIGDAYSVVNTKPAPDLFLWVAGGLRVPVTEAVVFEDAKVGIDAALAAGFWSVGIGASDVHHAHIVLPDLTAITPVELISRIEELRAPSN